MSGRAWACVVTNVPAPMVAASATAILNDISLSVSFGHPSRATNFRGKSRKTQDLPPVCPRIVNRVR
jgi:hypothetical protein